MSDLTGLILIVDDTPTNLEVVSEALSDAGFDIAIATSGDRALQQLERRLPDLILLDVMMPGMDGFETCRRIKANSRTRDIPVIFMTALADTDSKVKSFDLGAVDFITKPFHEREVLARVRTHLQLHCLTQNLAEQVAQKAEALEASQLQLIQNEKMSALGNLVAGVAHEINNPIACIVGNVNAIHNSVTELFEVIDLYCKKFPEPGAEIEAALEDLDYLREDLPKLIRTLQDSGNRITAISKSLRTFSRADTDQMQPFNLHEGMNSTILILRHRLRANSQRPEIQVTTEYGQLPMIQCFPGQLNQVFMNLLANAIDALEESNRERSYSQIQANPNQIIIRTEIEQDQVKVSIADNGVGIPETIKEKIFHQRFTTKAVGKGTGLGLAIVQKIIVDNHHGTIQVKTETQKGTEFVLRLPLI